LRHIAILFEDKAFNRQIKGSNKQFSTPLYLPPGQKKCGVSGHNKKPIIIRYFRGIILNFGAIIRDNLKVNSKVYPSAMIGSFLYSWNQMGLD